MLFFGHSLSLFIRDHSYQPQNHTNLIQNNRIIVYLTNPTRVQNTSATGIKRVRGKQKAAMTDNILETT